MEVFTLDRKFLQQQAIDVFHSIIWAERYYGDSTVELVVPLTEEMIEKLAPGTFLGIDKSDEVMILESMTIEEKKMKFSGQSLLPWLNNRFIRASVNHHENSWFFGVGTPGWALWAIVWNMCHRDSPYLNGTLPMGIPNPQRLIIPGLELKDYDKSGIAQNFTVPYGPVYDVMKQEIAEPYEIGMQITLESATDSSYVLGFRSYKGLDRTTGQLVNPPVRFSPEMESLTKINELQSIVALKTLVYTFAAQLDEEDRPLATTPGIASLTGPQYTGFDLRALQVLIGEITSEAIEDSAQKLLDLLNTEAARTLTANPVHRTVEGEITPEHQYQYGRDYNLGDIIEVQGNTNIVSISRVTEYIHSQDEAGERSYPTLTMLD